MIYYILVEFLARIALMQVVSRRNFFFIISVSISPDDSVKSGSPE